jgi:magnesium transporter
MSDEKIFSQNLIDVDDELMDDIRDLIGSRSDFLIKNIFSDLYPADIAHIINRLEFEEGDYLFSLLSTEDAGRVIVELDDDHREHFLETLKSQTISEIVEELPSDEATDIVGELTKEKAEEVLEELSEKDSSDLQELLRYDKSTAGGLMQKEVIVVHKKETVKKAVQAVRRAAREYGEEQLYNVFVVDDDNVVVGMLSISNLILLSPNRRIYKVMNPDIITIPSNMDQEEVAQIFKKYNAVSLPVVDNGGRLLGRITVDDIVDVMQEEHDEDVAHLIGSDAEELESRSPSQIAVLRLPWVLLTLLIELLAGVVISNFDGTLSRIILLASFMPIISAISGNTGLQSAAIIVRGLATGHVKLSEWWIPVLRQLQTTLIIGGVCGLVIGTIGGIWYGKVLFGGIVGFSMFISINISGFVGTSIPMLSKSLGFDPAITAGPFETAFQDVVGVTIFLSIATSLLHWL